MNKGIEINDCLLPYFVIMILKIELDKFGFLRIFLWKKSQDKENLFMPIVINDLLKVELN